MTPETSTIADVEQHLSISDIAGKLRVSEDKVRRMFCDEAGVLKIGHPTLLAGRKYRRRYYTLRIPMSVFLRVVGRLQRPQPSPEPRQRRRSA